MPDVPFLFWEHLHQHFKFLWVRSHTMSGNDFTKKWDQYASQMAFPLFSFRCNIFKNVFTTGTLGVLPDTYPVPISYILGVGVWHIDAM